ncbi:MAG TPA: Ser-Thr-rich GPI-anchored membrane family protein [Cyclobacteriaceae bacterium]|nr:Ser-Thr-rich GPI-anchored membrane family protein [Cyclobacteriaceae bacterium]
MKRLSVCLIGICLAVNLSAQDFAIKKMEVTPDQVIIHYDLVDTTRNRTYSVFLYSSVDNFLSPVTKVFGDLGIEVRPGLNKKISWNSKEELGPNFNGEVSLEVRGRMYVPFIRFDGFEDVPVRKRKTPFIVKWSGGTRQNILNFQLYKGEKLVHTFPNAPNENEYKLEIPMSVRPGDGYYFRIADSKNRDQVVITPQFQIKRKYPLVLQALPVGVVGAVAFLLIAREKGPDYVDAAPPAPNQE